MHRSLRRELGVPAAVLLGLGSIVGTGVFVSIGIAAGVTGATVVWAVIAAGFVAAANGLSSAQLAAAHPVSGGTYIYAGRLLSPTWGFVAGWMFLCAKGASAATAALGFAGYMAVATGWSADLQRPIALALVAAIGAVVLSGLRRSSAVNSALIGFVLGVLVLFIVLGSREADMGRAVAAGTGGVIGWFEATALMFVAYTGYGRIATLGEEVRRPEVTIPRAIIATMIVTILLYGGVAAAAVGVVGAEALSAATVTSAAPLAAVADTFSPELALAVELAAIVAMAGVLLNLVLGLSRVVLAMGRGRDLPGRLAAINDAGTTPVPATVLTLVVVAVLVMIGDVRTTWTFSAVTVLVYYTLTNVSALQLESEQRRFPRWIAAAGAAACLGLAVFIEPVMWLVAALLLGVGFGVRRLVRGP